MDHRQSHFPADAQARLGSPGLFFNWPTTTAQSADTICRFSTFQVMTTLGNRIYTQARDDGQLAVTTMPKFLRFQPDIQPTLMFVEGAQKKVHVLMQHLGRVRSGLLTLGTFALMNWSLFHGQASC